MCLVHKQAVNAEFLKADDIVFSRLVVELLELRFQLLSAFHKLLDRHTLATLRFQRIDCLCQFVNLLSEGLCLPDQRDGNLLKLAVPDDDGVIISRCDTGAEFLSVACLKVLFRCHQQIGGGIELQIFACPLLNEVVWHHDHGFVAESEPLALLRRRNHREGLASPNHMGKERIAAVQDSCNCVLLVLAECDFGVHAIEAEMVAVVGSGADAVELLIVEPRQLLPPFGILPDPLRKRPLDFVLFSLCNGRFLLVQHRFFVAVRILHIIKDPDILEIQRVLNDLIGIDSGGTVGAVGTDIVPVIIFAGDAPLRRCRNKSDLHPVAHPDRRAEQFKDELFDHIVRHPGGPKPHADLPRRQVGRLNRFKCRDILRILRVLLRGVSRFGQLDAHIAGEVFVRRQELLLPAAVLPFGIAEQNAVKLGKDVRLAFFGQLLHKRQIHRRTLRE